MQASSTTMNISGGGAAAAPAPEDTPKPKQANTHGHNHKWPNFGRWMADCPACLAKHPDGPPKPKKPALVPKMTKDELMELLREHAPGLLNAPTPQGELGQLVQLLLDKEAKTAVKEQEELKQREVARADMLRITQESEAIIKRHQEACSHTKENGRSAIMQGQVYNDGFMKPFCQRCFKTFGKRRPSPEEQSTAVG